VIGDGTTLCHSEGPSGIECSARGGACFKTGPLRFNQYGHAYDGVCMNGSGLLY
jgi:hypothetical protein